MSMMQMGKEYTNNKKYMQQPIGHIFQTLFQHMHEIFLITPTLKQALVSRIIHGNTIIVFFYTKRQKQINGSHF